MIVDIEFEELESEETDEVLKEIGVRVFPITIEDEENYGYERSRD